MKKLLFIFFLFCSLFAVAYKWFIVHPGYAPKVNSYGNLYNRLIADSAVHIPNKTCLCTNDNDTTPQLFIYMDTLRGFWNGVFHNIGFGSGGGSGVDTIYVTQIGTGSPQIPLVYAVNGSLRVARLVPGVFTTPFMNADSAAGINVDTTGSAGIAYKLWIIAQYGPPMGGSGTNIFNSNGTLTADRTLSGSYTHQLGLDSLTQLVVNAHGFVVTSDNTPVNGLQSGQDNNHYLINAYNNASTITNVYYQTMDSAWWTITNSSTMLFSITHNTIRSKGLSQANDSTAYKPLGIGTDGSWKRMDGWPGGGGGGAALIQTITSGTSGTVTGSNYWVRFNPASLLATYTLTLPASPTIGQSVVIHFGGTITSGIVITAFTVAPNTSQTILDNTPPAGSSALVDDTYQYDYIATNLWQRRKL